MTEVLVLKYRGCPKCLDIQILQLTGQHDMCGGQNCRQQKGPGFLSTEWSWTDWTPRFGCNTTPHPRIKKFMDIQYAAVVAQKSPIMIMGNNKWSNRQPQTL